MIRKKQEKLIKNGITFIPFEPMRSKKPFRFKGEKKKYQLYFDDFLYKKMTGIISPSDMDLEPQIEELENSYHNDVKALNKKYDKGNSLYKSELDELNEALEDDLSKLSSKNLMKKYQFTKPFDEYVYEFGKYLVNYTTNPEVFLKKNGNLKSVGVDLFIFFVQEYNHTKDHEKIDNNLREIFSSIRILFPNEK